MVDMLYDACTEDQDVRLGLQESATVVRGQAEQPAALQRDREAGSHQRPCDLAPYIIFEEGVHLEEHGDPAARAAGGGLIAVLQKEAGHGKQLLPAPVGAVDNEKNGRATGRERGCKYG